MLRLSVDLKLCLVLYVNKSAEICVIYCAFTLIFGFFIYFKSFYSYPMIMQPDHLHKDASVKKEICLKPYLVPHYVF